MAIQNFKAKYGVQVADSVNQSGFDLLPIGSIMYWVGPATQSVDGSGIATAAGIPAGWLLCDGSTVSRSAYPNLDAVFASATPLYPYGNGNGSTTFNLPDCRGRALEQEGFTPTNSAKQLTGSETYTLLDSNIVTHNHTVNTHSHTGLNSHTHPGPTHAHANGPTHTHPATHSHLTNGAGNHVHSVFSVNTSSAGSGPLRSSVPQVTAVVTSTLSNMPHSHSSSGDSGVVTSGGDQGLLFGIFVNSSTNTSADSNSSTAPFSSPTGFNGASTRTSFSLMQPFVVLHVIIKA
jgi:microcystin-dependent protein